ncbi:MAG: ATP synthase F1 subunit epsilon [Chloroflexi bacterium RBG_16_56_11]|nr:MAG: ATP synthase F1 subunit epsilon [Chloroflexi bacterium RBG_16_56_11]
MSSIKVEIVTAERVVYTQEAEAVIAPGVGGQLGILPHHAPLMTILQAGELVVRHGGQEDALAISGGFLEVRPDRIIILADQAERAEEIDVARAEAAKQRAEERLKDRHMAGLDETRAEAALRRAVARITVAEKIKRRRNL